MKIATVNGVQLEYEILGAGEPVLLISPVLADGFVPLLSEPVLSDHYQLIRYHKRGWLGSTHTGPPVSPANHAADAAALLADLGVRTAHVVGHSSGAAVAVQLALSDPQAVATLALLELSLLSVPSGKAFFQAVTPAFEAYARGDHSEAVASFLSVAGGTDWATCHALLDRNLPGSVDQAIKDADTFFGVELPGLAQWEFGAEQAAAITQPVLSMSGSRTQPLWVEVADFLHTTIRRVEECVIDDVGHLLHIERSEPVARGIVQFLRGHPMSDDREALAGSRLL